MSEVEQTAGSRAVFLGGRENFANGGNTKRGNGYRINASVDLRCQSDWLILQWMSMVETLSKRQF